MMKWSIAWLFSTCMTSLSFRVTAVSMKIKNKKPLKSSVISHFLFLAAGRFPSPPSSSRLRDLVVKEKKMELIVIGNFLSNLLTKLLLPNNTLTSICLWELLKWRALRIEASFLLNQVMSVHSRSSMVSAWSSKEEKREECLEKVSVCHLVFLLMYCR